MKRKPVKTGEKVFDITDMMMADLMFFLRPMKERQQEMRFWSSQVTQCQNEIVSSLGIDSTKFSVSWEDAYRTGRLVFIPLPKPVIEKENGKLTDSKGNKK